jgi:hypothetical protein
MERREAKFREILRENVEIQSLSLRHHPRRARNELGCFGSEIELFWLRSAQS